MKKVLIAIVLCMALSSCASHKVYTHVDYPKMHREQVRKKELQDCAKIIVFTGLGIFIILTMFGEKVEL